MISAYQQPVISKPTSQFTEALTTDQISANYELTLPNKTPLWFIRAFSLVAVQNLTYELWLFNTANNVVDATATMATDGFMGVWQFQALAAGPPAGPGYPVTPAAGGGVDPLYHYYVDGNLMPYWDLDQLTRTFAPPPGAGATSEAAHLHVRLVNRDATAKNAGATGAVKLTAYVATQGAQV